MYIRMKRSNIQRLHFVMILNDRPNQQITELPLDDIFRLVRSSDMVYTGFTF